MNELLGQSAMSPSKKEKTDNSAKSDNYYDKEGKGMYRVKKRKSERDLSPAKVLYNRMTLRNRGEKEEMDKEIKK